VRYRIADVMVEDGQARIVLEEVVEEGVGDGFAETVELGRLRSMSVDELKSSIREWIKARRELLKRAEEERKRAEEESKEFEALKGEEVEVAEAQGSWVAAERY